MYLCGSCVWPSSNTTTPIQVRHESSSDRQLHVYVNHYTLCMLKLYAFKSATWLSTSHLDSCNYVCFTSCTIRATSYICHVLEGEPTWRSSLLKARNLMKMITKWVGMIKKINNQSFWYQKIQRSTARPTQRSHNTIWAVLLNINLKYSLVTTCQNQGWCIPMCLCCEELGVCTVPVWLPATRGKKFCLLINLFVQKRVSQYQQLWYKGVYINNLGIYIPNFI